MSTIQDIAQAVETGKLKLIEGLVTNALQEGLEAVTILNEGMIKALAAVGEKFQRSEIFVPEMLVAARTMKKGVEILKPKLGSGATTSFGKCIIGTVQGDLHDIGKNLVAMMIESAGFEVIDLGVDVSKDQFINAITSNPDAKVVALSALLTTTMPMMQDTARAIKGGRFTVKVMVGGAPITQEFADQIGADGYSTDAAGAAQLAKKLAA
ncbi:MAG: corrinoid protein [Treponema sp.]|jgi:5-methyltetrahydrofolate--homocysteine methyltransferase|nr:corrinoid protein [Treponema sp.]